MSLSDLLSKTTIANVCAGIIVIGSLVYFFYTKNTDGMLFMSGAGVGYLFKTAS